MTWVLLASLSVFISEELHLTATNKGFMVAVPVLIGAVGRIAVGVCTDRYGARRIGVVTLLLTVIPLAYGWLLAETFVQMLFVGMLLGVAGTSFAVALPLAARTYPFEHQGFAMGIVGSGNSGSILSLALAPLVAERVGWHAVFGLMMPVVLITTAIYAWLTCSRPGETPDGQPKQSLQSLLGERDVRLAALLYAVSFGGFVGFTSFLSMFFFDQYGVSPSDAGMAAACCAFAGSAARPLGGYIADWYGATRVLRTVLPCILFLTALMAPLLPFTLTFFTALVLLAGLGLANGAIFQHVALPLRVDIGKVAGVIGAAGGLAVFMLPFAFGLLRDETGTYASGFACFAVLVTGAILALWRSTGTSFDERA